MGDDFPQYAVSKWIGHSIAVSGKHYANSVPDEVFDRAAGARGDRIASVSARPGRSTKALEVGRKWVNRGQGGPRGEASVPALCECTETLGVAGGEQPSSHGTRA